MNKLILIISIFWMFSCSSTPSITQNDLYISTIEAIKNNLTNLGDGIPQQNNTTLTTYLYHYGFQYFPREAIQVGWIPNSKMRIFSITVTPNNSQGTILFVHGYLDHLAAQFPIVKMLYDAGWAVILIDLPGHGLSDGDPGSIDDFAQYETIIDKTALYIKDSMPKPYYAIGHSTGCSALMQYLYSGNSIFSKTIFLAPLVRIQSWDFAKLCKPVVLGLGINFNSFDPSNNNPEFLKKVQGDWLKTTTIDHRWVKAMFDWNVKNQLYGKLNSKILVIQGDNDTVVDYNYNMLYIIEHFIKARVILIKNASHFLINETPEITKKVYNEILSYISAS